MRFFNRKNKELKNKELNRKLTQYDEVNHTEDMILRNAQDSFLERLNDDNTVKIARYHAIRKEINDNDNE